MPPTIAQPDQSVIQQASILLQQGELVAIPTETVYGLGADTFNVAALRQVYELKGRPADNPLITHVQDAAAAARVVARWDERCAAIAQRFWPGPLTLVIEKADAVPDEATAGLKTIAVRCPNHPVAMQLLRAFGSPISAPSANRSGHVSPTTAQHVVDDFSDCDVLLIIDGGPCAVGIESTVLDLSTSTPRVLRPGSVSIEQLSEVLGTIDAPTMREQAHSPGTSSMHYAPNTPAVLVASDALHETLRDTDESVVVIAITAKDNTVAQRIIVMPGEPAAYAMRLYSALRDADTCGAQRIIIERPPDDDPAWLAVHDRLRRATASA